MASTAEYIQQILLSDQNSKAVAFIEIVEGFACAARNLGNCLFDCGKAFRVVEDCAPRMSGAPQATGKCGSVSMHDINMDQVIWIIVLLDPILEGASDQLYIAERSEAANGLVVNVFVVQGMLISGERIDTGYSIEERWQGNRRVATLNSEFKTGIGSEMKPLY
jgi:hypothetical protein